MRKRTLPRLLIGATLLAIAVRTVLAWSELPEVMASHFGPSGRADGWQDKTRFFAMIAVLMALMPGLQLAIGLLLPRLPASAINLPHREYWLAPERRSATIESLAAAIDWFGVAVTIMLAGTLELTIRANLAQQPLDSRFMATLLIALFASLAGWLVYLWRRFTLRDPVS